MNINPFKKKLFQRTDQSTTCMSRHTIQFAQLFLNFTYSVFRCNNISELNYLVCQVYPLGMAGLCLL